MAMASSAPAHLVRITGFSTMGGRVFLLLFFVCIPACGYRSTPEPLAIGQVLSLSGPKKERAEHARNGAALAIDMALSGDRRVLGRKVVVRHVDDRGDPELVQPEAVRLLTLNRAVALIGSPDAATDEQLARAARTYAIPVLLTADLASVPTGEAIFCLNAAPEDRGDALARFAVRDRQCRRVVVLTDGQSGPGVPLALAFVKRWRQEFQNDKSASIEEWTWKNAAEWPDLTRRVAAAKPDGVMIAAAPETFNGLRTQLASAGLRFSIFYGGEDVGAANLPIPGNDEPAVYLATPFAATADLEPDGKAFVTAYTDKYHEPPDLSAALAYDAVKLLVDAIERAKTWQPPRLTTELTAANLSSVTGPLSLADRRAKRRLFVVALEKAGASVVATFAPNAE
jgi:branched-chain amino acid transport system substrate-binding protein